MTDDRDDVTNFAGLPMQPTGSGVADLEMQREKDAVAEGEAPERDGTEAEQIIPPEQPPMDDAAGPLTDVTVSGGE